MRRYSEFLRTDDREAIGYGTFLHLSAQKRFEYAVHLFSCNVFSSLAHVPFVQISGFMEDGLLMIRKKMW